MSSVRYRTRLGDLKNKQSTHTLRLFHGLLETFKFLFAVGGPGAGGVYVKVVVFKFMAKFTKLQMDGSFKVYENTSRSRTAAAAAVPENWSGSRKLSLSWKTTA
jgi:glycine cleavage system protein P-like pyridoxal-binding family